MGFRRIQNAVIPAGAALSNAVYPGAGKIIGIQMPAVWTAAGLSFQGSVDGVVFEEMVDRTGVLLAQTALVGQFIALDDLYLQGPLWVIIRSGTLASAVNQVAAAILQVVMDKDMPGRI